MSFQYDNRGNLRVGDGLTMTYNAIDKPLSVSGRGATTSFVYGSDNMRAKQSRTVGSATTTTYYVDKYYEADSDGSWRAYLDDIAVLSYTSQRGHLLQFTLKDRLGSATTLADQNGNIVSQRYFDPFGRTTDLGINHKLDIQNKNTTLSQLQDLAVTNKNRRGFTDHEHLNEQQLIHMNGRVYDYNLGRFMSVDPLIQSPTSTQSINPYSYIMNNPLAGTDPTGYCAAATGTHIKDCGDMKVTSTVTMKDGTSKTASTVVKDVNFKNGADVKSSFTSGAAAATADAKSLSSIGSLQERAKQGSSSGPQNKDTPENGNAGQPNLIYGQLAEGLQWSDFSTKQQEYVQNQSAQIANATADILAIPPGSVLDTDDVKAFRNNYDSIIHRFHNRILKNSSGNNVLAMVQHTAMEDGSGRGIISRVLFSKVVDYSGNTMASFRSAQKISSLERSLGYHQSIRAGLNGLYDVSIHEMAHTFNQTNAIGLTGQDFQFKEESRADYFLKTIRGNSL